MINIVDRLAVFFRWKRASAIDEARKQAERQARNNLRIRRALKLDEE